MIQYGSLSDYSMLEYRCKCRPCKFVGLMSSSRLELDGLIFFQEKNYTHQFEKGYVL